MRFIQGDFGSVVVYRIKEFSEQGPTVANFMQLTFTSKSCCCRTEITVEGQEPYIAKQIIMSTNKKSCTF